MSSHLSPTGTSNATIKLPWCKKLQTFYSHWMTKESDTISKDPRHKRQRWLKGHKTHEIWKTCRCCMHPRPRIYQSTSRICKYTRDSLMIHKNSWFSSILFLSLPSFDRFSCKGDVKIDRLSQSALGWITAQLESLYSPEAKCMYVLQDLGHFRNLLVI